MSRVIRTGIIGGGANSAIGRAHISALRLDGRFEIVGACFSRTHEMNQISKDEYFLPKCELYASSEILLQEIQSDVIIVLTPTPNHVYQIESALTRHINIISEKSLTTSFAETRELEKLLSIYNSNLWVTLNYSGYPMVRELKNRIIENDLGRVFQIDIDMPQETFLRNYKIQDWRKKDYAIPTLSLDLGVHAFHLARFLIGEPLFFVNGTNYQTGNLYGVVDRSNCELISESNMISVNLKTSKVHLGNRNGLKIKVFGNNKSAVWVQETPDQIFLASQDGSKEIVDRGSKLHVAGDMRYQRFKAGHPTGFIESLANLYWDIHQEIILNSTTEYTSGIEEALNFANVFDTKNSNWNLRRV